MFYHFLKIYLRYNTGFCVILIKEEISKNKLSQGLDRLVAVQPFVLFYKIGWNQK